MTVVLDSRRIAADDRRQAVLEAIGALKVPVAIQFSAGSGPLVRGTFTDLGSLRICSIRGSGTRVERTERMTGDGTEPSAFVALQKSGSSVIVQDGRQAVLQPGDLVVFDSTAPFTIVDDGGIRQWQIKIPIARLGLPLSLLRRVSATTLSPDDPVADLATAHFHRVVTRPEVFVEHGADAVAAASIELVRALINTHVADSVALRESMQATLPLRIMEFVRARLGDPELTVAMVAAAHHISVRHLYNVLADSGISLGAWIRTERLERSRTDLARAGAGGPTVAAIARRWGFIDASGFARQFRAAYGVTPREWRAVNQLPVH